MYQGTVKVCCAALLVAAVNIVASGCSKASDPPGAADEAMAQARDAMQQVAGQGAQASGDVAGIDAKLTELGLGAAAASMYVTARECGIGQAALDAYKVRERETYSQAMNYPASQFDADFEAAMPLLEKRRELDGSYMQGAKGAGTCDWVKSTMQG